MGKRPTQGARDAELMGEDIVGIYLSREPLCESNQLMEDDEPKLRHFVHHQEKIQTPRLVGSGGHGVVIVAVIKGAEYTLKIVSEISLIAVVI